MAQSRANPVSSVGKNFPHCVCLPYAILLGRDELEVEISANRPQGQPACSVLAHHSDRGLLAVVPHELVVQVVETEE